MQRISKSILKIIGWKVGGFDPTKTNKYVLVVMHHTSSWEIPIGLLVRSALQMNTKFAAKASLFRPPFGYIFKMLGGYPINRIKSNNFVETLAKTFDLKEKFSVVITPEGTRKKVDKLKTGFFHLARAANVPIIFCAIDFKTKKVIFSNEHLPSEDYNETYQKMKSFYTPIVAKRENQKFNFN